MDYLPNVPRPGMLTDLLRRFRANPEDLANLITLLDILLANLADWRAFLVIFPAQVPSGTFDLQILHVL